MQLSDHPHKITIWFTALRVPLFTGSLFGLMMGSSFAVMDRIFQPHLFLWSILALVTFQGATHLVGEYLEYKKGNSYRTSLVASGVLERDWLLTRHVLQMAMALYSISLAVVINISILITSTVPVWFYVIALLIGILVVRDPFVKLTKGIRELGLVLLYGPLLIAGTYYIQVGWIRPTVLWSSIPYGILAAGVLYLSHMQNRKPDKLIYALSIGLTLVIPLLLIVLRLLPFTSFTYAFTFPFAWTTIRRVYRCPSSAALNLSVGYSILLFHLYGVLFTLGLIIHSFFE